MAASPSMSYENEYPRASRSALFFSASSIVSPMTNCLPSSRIARSTPTRMTGSPLLPINRVKAVLRPFSLLVATSLPVTSRPQAAALTNSDGLLPTCDFQSPLPILSRMSLSAVSTSGMRSRASARHMSATPSWPESENSRISASTPLDPDRRARTCVTSRRAVS